MSHWSADFETLGLKPDTKVLSLGLAKFDIKTGEILETKLWRFSPKGQEHRTKTPSTEEWWQKQSEEAKAEAFGGKQSLEELMKDCDEYFKYDPKAMLWGNGANFDVAILDNIFSYEAPWDFWNVRDMRTLVWIASITGFDKESIVFEGEKHSAVDDAVHQAKVISAAYRQIKGLYNVYKKLKSDYYDLKVKYQDLLDKVDP